ncbi:hypothetical protein, partial [Staphylococcus aureus]|uniref:hypothetical protein n=1 Tax=Staphylococcus aureus TaxID=1280 RepID=UPI001E311C1F
MVTRLRLDGTIPWEAFTDSTRPFKDYQAFDNAQLFARQETERYLKGFWRNLQQSQPNHVEILVEKNTVYTMAMQVADKYQ